MDDLQTLNQGIEQAKSIIIFPVADAPLDGIAASLGLYLILEESGKMVTIASETEPVVRDSRIVGLDKITKEIGNSNLVISFPYAEEKVEKVSYNVNGDQFNLIIQPRSGSTPVKQEELSYNYTGADADLIFVIGAQAIKDVGNILTQEKELLQKATIVNISNKTGNFGKVNLVDPNSSLSEIVVALTTELNLKINEDVANNLMRGIEEATDNLSSPNLTADTFEALAMLYRAGARRQVRGKPTPEAKESVQAITRDIQSTKDKAGNIVIDVQSTSIDEDKPDWLTPKIFKGSTKV